MNDSKTVTLSLAQWQLVWAAVQTRPFGEIAEVAMTMKEQLSAEDKKPAENPVALA